MKNRPLRIALRALFVLFLSWLGLTLLAGLFYPRLLYHPVREHSSLTPRTVGIAYDDVWLSAADGAKINGWFVHGATSETGRKTLLVFHGNAGNLSTATHRLVGYAKTGLDVFMIDYHGFGKSEGAPDEENLYLDSDAAWEYLVRERGVVPGDIVIAGYSLGGAVAARLAEKHPEAGGLVLESTFTRLADVAADLFPYLPCALILGDAYPTLDRLSRINLPLLVIHGRGDELVAFKFGKILYEAYHGKKEFFRIADDHNIGFLLTGDSYFAAVHTFATTGVAGR